VLAAAGFNLVICARDQQVLDSLAAHYREAFRNQALVHAADLSSIEGVSSLADFVRDLDIGLFVHAAGYGTSGFFRNADLNVEQNMLQLNCMSTLRLTHHFSRTFADRKRGGIILLSSIVAFQGVPHAAHYAATKAYVQSLAEGLFRELKPLGVDVLSAAPGPVESGFGRRAHMYMRAAMKPEDIAVPILRALGRGSTIFPGRLTKTLIFGLWTVPRWAKVRIMEKVMDGMTRNGK
jgi:short-subunit dehydrogenase